MKIRLLLISLISTILFVLSFSFIKADLVPYTPPPPCNSDEQFFKKNEINPNLYQKITFYEPEPCKSGKPCPVVWDIPGYCVDLNEYCSINKCSKPLLIKLYNNTLNDIPSVSIETKEFIFYLLINLFINTFLILVILHFSDTTVKRFFNVKHILLILLVTILGLIADIFAMVFSGGLIELLENIAIQFIRLIPANIMNLLAIGISAFLMVFVIFYITFARDMFLERGNRIKASLFYAFISNPFWFLLVKTVFNQF